MTRYPFTTEDVERALVDLGESVDAVAATLTTQGFKGEVDDCQRCPVAVYLLAVVEELADVQVGDDFCALTGYRLIDGHPQAMELRAMVPDAVYDFIHDFDGHAYPELVREAAA